MPLPKRIPMKLPADMKRMSQHEDWVALNVGGTIFTTTRTTLVGQDPDSMLARMFSSQTEDFHLAPSIRDSTGAFLLDRSPKYFEPLLNYLRTGKVILDHHMNPQGVLEEAKYFRIESVIPQLQALVPESVSRDEKPLTRRDVIEALMHTSSASHLRFQGLNLEGADLSRLDLRQVNFKYACLKGCRLIEANLSYTCLERADLSNADLESAQLMGVRMACANLEGANLTRCTFSDPLGKVSNLEGVNLKGATLENSDMEHINLRVAKMRNANVRNCDLRGACLAGADLEGSDLSGSDLHEANLRGANLKDCTLEGMVTPIHMSQTTLR